MGKLVGAIWTAVTLLLSAGAAESAGLGRLNVQSALGQPLVAEIDLVSVSAEELPSLAARLASPNAYQDANVDYPSGLGAVTFSVERRASGEPYVRIQSSQPVNEPFVELLVELSWSSGRILREYPVLLDPPGYAAQQAQPPSPLTLPRATAPAPSVSAAPAPQAPITAKPVARADDAAAASAETYGPVKRGETLRRIAQLVKPEGVTLEQMLVGLYRENRGAFARNNMNHLKAGLILKLPAPSRVSTIEQPVAVKEVSVQTADWNAYRRRLAAVAAKRLAEAKPATQTVEGKVTTTIVDQGQAPADAGKDVLKLSKMQPSKGQATDTGAQTVTQLHEELVARDRALQEATTRISALEKQINDMKRLLELKGAPAAATEAPAAKPELQKPVIEPTAKVEPQAQPPGEEAKPMPPATQAEGQPMAEGEPRAPATTGSPPAEAGQAKPKPKKRVTLSSTPTETSLLDSIIGNPIVLGGAVVILGLLGLLAARMIRKRREQQQGAFIATGAIAGGFKATGVTPAAAPLAGAALTTSQEAGNSSFLSDFDKLGPGNIDTDEVDPVAEADVYIAYGRDAQAEEILKEAMAKDASRYEIPMKLLEIYSNRKSISSFETIAKQLHGSLGMQHPLWAKVAEMGRKLDADNPLYAPASSTSPRPVAVAGNVTHLAGASALVGAAAKAEKEGVPSIAHETLTLKESSVAEAPLDLEFDLSAAEGKSDNNLIDFGEVDAQATGMDLDLDAAGSQDQGTVDVGFEPSTPAQDAMTLDFDLTGAGPATSPGGPAEAPKAGSMAPDLSLDFDLGETTKPSESSAAAEPPAAAESAGLDLSLDLPDLASNTMSGASELENAAALGPPPSQVDLPPLDLSGIDLDLKTPGESDTPAATGDASGNWQSATTKLDLARAYLEIGDKVGALEILHEVMKEGSPDQQTEAKQLASEAA